MGIDKWVVHSAQGLKAKMAATVIIGRYFDSTYLPLVNGTGNRIQSRGSLVNSCLLKGQAMVESSSLLLWNSYFPVSRRCISGLLGALMA